uniref:Uncharacterized protein n=1 Tax=Ixodes ricinus TaxID=34613 RepID=A0A147BEK1_IXORI
MCRKFISILLGAWSEVQLQSPVDRNRLAGHVAGACEEVDHFGHFVRTSGPSQGDARTHPFQVFRCRHLCRNESWHQEVDGDVAGSHLLGQGAREAHQGGLAGAVHRLPHIASVSHHAAYVDDAAFPSPQHVLQSRLRAEDGPHQVGVEQTTHVGLSCLQQKLVENNA